ncbi:MAG: hypothetical protein K6G18_13825 [Treponema sp.]|nr:hypothetical protein [Treponema sp.]
MEGNMIAPMMPHRMTGGSLVSSAIGSVAECIETLNRGATEREAVRAKRDAVCTMLRERREAMIGYLNSRFGERCRLYDGYFALIDRALETGNDGIVQAALESLIHVYSAPVDVKEDGIMEQYDRLAAALGC